MESSEEAGELKTVKVNKDTEHIPMRTNYRADIKKLIIRRNTRDSNTIIIPLNVN